MSGELTTRAWIGTVAGLVCVLACDEADDAFKAERRAQHRKQVAEEAYTEDASSYVLTYSVDPRTGLCFASHGTPGYYSYAITNVPCTPTVCELVGGCK